MQTVFLSLNTIWQDKHWIHSFSFIEPSCFIALVGQWGLQAKQDLLLHDLLGINQFITCNWVTNAKAAPVGHKYLQKPLSIKKTKHNTVSVHKIRIVEVLNLWMKIVSKGSICNSKLFPVV